jgi:DNA-binding SARP family transcriptional activator
LALQGGEGAADPGIQRRGLALLALLAGSPDTALSRDKLLLYLWPEGDEGDARNALRQVLHTLRKALAAPELLLGSTDLRLNPSLISSDVADFQAALSRADFERAADLYRGHFLDGFHLGQSAEFELWVDTKRGEYASQAGAALEKGARAAASRGDLGEAVTWWRRLAGLEPLSSRVTLELMNALVAVRDPAAALQHARVHEALVREQLEASPDPSIAALVDQLRRADSTAGPRMREQTSVPSAERGATTPAGSLWARLQPELATRYVMEQEILPREGTTRLFLARDLRYERQVIVKVLHPSLASAVDTERFLREIALMARLQHPNIVPVLDSGETRSHLWYVAPYLEGESLRIRLTLKVQLPLRQALGFGRGVALGLDYAHRQGVVHRDIRPETILLVGDQALVTNFGVARALNVAAGPNLTATGMLMGAPAYMSPEQIRGGRVDPRSDVYSLGCVIQEMITGQAVHSGPTPQAILVRRLGRQDPKPSLPGDTGEIIGKALADDPEGRYSTATELLQALERVASLTP